MPAPQPTIIATSIGFLADGPDPTQLRPGPSYQLAAELAQAGPHPKVCIIGTATGDDSSRLAAHHNAFAKLGMISSHLALTPMPSYPDVRAHLLAQDVIWVSGGSTANLLAMWRAHGLDLILRECWEAGVVLKGVSAGSLCWHIGGTTDSFGLPLHSVNNGLAFLPYSNSPHHDAEPERRPLIHRLIADGTLPDGYATENGTGLIFYGTELQEAFTEVEGKLAYSLVRSASGDSTIETALPTRLLRP
jgi:peptidase E